MENRYRVKNRVLAKVFLITLMLTVLFFVVFYIGEKRQYDETIHKFESVLHNTIKNVLITKNNRYQIVIEEILELTDIPQLTANQDNAAVYRIVKPKWEKLRKENPFLTSMTFYTKSNSIFLEMDDAPQHQDRSVERRLMVKEVHKRRVPLAGFESSLSHTDYKIVHPIFYQDRYVGAIELSLDASLLVRRIEEISQNQGCILVNEKTLKGDQMPGEHFQIDHFILQSGVEGDMKQILQNLPATFKFQHERLEAQVGERHYILHVEDLENYQAGVEAKLLVFHDITETKETYFHLVQIVLALFVLFLLIIFFILNQAFNTLITHISMIFEKLQKAQQIAKIGYWEIDIANEKLRWSEEMYLIYGLERDGVPVDMDVSLRVIENEYEKNHVRLALKELGEKKSYQAKYRIVDASGKEKYLYEEAELQYDIKKESAILFGYTEDITEIYQAQEKITYNEMYLNTVLNTDKNIIITTVEGQELYTGNRAFLDFTGFESVEAFKEKYDCFCDLFEKVDDPEYLFKEVDGVSWLEYIYRTPDLQHKALVKKGETVHIFLVNASKMELDEKNRSVVSFTDISEVIRFQKKLQEKEELMIAQSRQAAMGDMIAMIAHQWRQPISVIGLNAGDILTDIELGVTDHTSWKESLESIEYQVEHLSKTIDDFKDFFKPNKAKESVSVNMVIENALRTIGKSIDNNNIRLTKTFRSETTILTYPNELLQVLLNLINNAKDVIKERGVENGEISIETHDEKGEIIIEVCDNGGGIEEMNKPKIFNPYFTSKGKNGTGLGLYMSKTILNKHLGGELTFQNKGQGVCFRIVLSKEED